MMGRTALRERRRKGRGLCPLLAFRPIHPQDISGQKMRGRTRRVILSKRLRVLWVRGFPARERNASCDGMQQDPCFGARQAAPGGRAEACRIARHAGRRVFQLACMPF